jgi:hypothetical protein
MFQETSPMSSEPPPVLFSSGCGWPMLPSFTARPFCVAFPSSFCSPFASAWSASLQVGNPTVLMFSYIVSATTLLK